MKKSIILLCGIALFYCNANAQVSAQLAGKKLQVKSSQKMNITISQNGNDMEMPMTSETSVNYEIKGITGKTIQLSGTLERVKGSMTMMGNETTYDTDDSTSEALSNPQVAEQLKDLHKAKDFTIELGKTPDMTDLEKQTGLDVQAYALFNPFDKLATEGSKLSDSTKNENGSKAVTEYVVSKISGDEITVTATTNSNISTTVEQNGMEVKVNMQTKNVSTRIYDASTGLLKTDIADINSSGTREITSMGMNIPITIKSTTTTTVL